MIIIRLCTRQAAQMHKYSSHVAPRALLLTILTSRCMFWPSNLAEGSCLPKHRRNGRLLVAAGLGRSTAPPCLRACMQPARGLVLRPISTAAPINVCADKRSQPWSVASALTRQGAPSHRQMLAPARQLRQVAACYSHDPDSGADGRSRSRGEAGSGLNEEQLLAATSEAAPGQAVRRRAAHAPRHACTLR